MKIKNIFFVLLIFSLFMASNNIINAQDNQSKDWKTFSKNLVKSLKSSNEGLQKSALQQIIRHGDKLDLKDGIFEITKIYRNQNENENFRRLALMALYKSNDGWAKDFLKRNLKYEKSKTLKEDIQALIQKSDESNKKASSDITSVQSTK